MAPIPGCRAGLTQPLPPRQPRESPHPTTRCLRRALRAGPHPRLRSDLMRPDPVGRGALRRERYPSAVALNLGYESTGALLPEQPRLLAERSADDLRVQRTDGLPRGFRVGRLSHLVSLAFSLTQT